MQDIIGQMESKMLSYREYFEQSHLFGTNEKLRDDNAANIDCQSYFGLDGSFRMLDID